MRCSALTGHAGNDAHKTANVFKMVEAISKKLVHQYITLILTRKLQCKSGYFEPCIASECLLVIIQTLSDLCSIHVPPK